MTDATPPARSENGPDHLISFELPAKVEFGLGRIRVLERVIEKSEFERRL